jgi:MOSC domain-containing protein YiiM
VSIVAQEDLDFLNAELGIALMPGDLGENITTQGLGSLCDVVASMHLFLGEHVMLEITEQNDPCQNINKYHHSLVKVSYRARRRGVLAIVKTGVGSKIRPNDMVYLYP